MLDLINLEIELYQENIGMLGMQGSGKTHLARKFLDMYPSVPRLIISPQNPLKNFGEYGYAISKISEIENDRAMVWNGDFSMTTFKEICNRISNEISDLMFVVDDCHEYCTKQQIIPEWERVIQSKRNDGIFGLYMTPAPNRINNTILQSLKHIFAFRMLSYSQVEWMQKNYFHNDAWILLEKKLRKEEPTQHADVEYLAKGSYIYKGLTNIHTQFHFSEFQNVATDETETTDSNDENTNQNEEITQSPIVATEESKTTDSETEMQATTIESKTKIAKTVKVEEEENGKNL